MTSHTQPAAAAANQRVAVVLTMKFREKGIDRTIAHLRAASRLGAAEVILLADAKDPEANARANAAIVYLADELRHAGVGARAVGVDAYSTARRWYFGLKEAFRDGLAAGALLFPGDIRQDKTGRVLSEEQIELLRRLVYAVERNTLLLVDYSTTDRFKTRFDGAVLFPAINLLYPDLVSDAQALGVSKMRSELALVGRDFFLDFLQHSHISQWGADPIIQLGLHAWRRRKEKEKEKGIDVDVRRFDSLGAMVDDADTRNAAGQVEQVIRLVDLMLGDRIEWSKHEMKRTPAEELAEFDRLRELVRQASDLKIRALDEVRSWLAGDLEV